jgi:L-lactate dehydrogenase complex protein LldE
MHVGGLLSRQRSGVRTMHLAEILAATEGAAASPVELVETKDPAS